LSQTGENFFARSKTQTGLLEKIELIIPGFRGYKEKELRRESDKLVRDQIYKRLYEAEAQVKDTYRTLVNQGAQDSWDDTDHLVARMDRITQRINHSEYGYAGFFDSVKVKEPDLDRMMAYDDQLLQQTDTITTAVQALKDTVDTGKLQDARSKVLDATKAIDALELAYNGRKDVIIGAA
jgi:hypothetical protein